MAKGKNINPADAFRKAQRKKELKKNKAERVKTRDFALVKKDTRDLEDEIKKFETAAELSASDKSRLGELKNELSRIMAKKEEYVKEHPEQRKLVYRPRRETGEDQKAVPPRVEQKRNLFNKHGLPRHPERSIYYDPVMNPYGVPPPGMPYMERPLTADEVNSDADAGDSDEDIAMPDGPPPGASLGEHESDSDDDIPMPEGLPPGVVQNQNSQTSPSVGTPQFPLPHPPQSLLPIPPIVPPFMSPPPPPLGFNGAVYAGPPGFVPPPLPPPGFFPRRTQLTASVQDPLSYITHQTYQVHRPSQLPPGHPSLPPKPSTGPSSTISAIATHTSATISAGPELRDLKKEATAFVPASLKRKKASTTPAPSKVNAAPSVSIGLEAPTPQARPDLVGVLRSQLGAAAPQPQSNHHQLPDKSSRTSSMKEKDDYQKFVDEVSDLLGPSSS